MILNVGYVQEVHLSIVLKAIQTVKEGHKLGSFKFSRACQYRSLPG